MSMYDDVKVSLSLGDLFEIQSTANGWEISTKECEALAAQNNDLKVENERLAKENNNLRCELSTRPQQPREVSPLLRQRIENAKDVLRQITPVVADCDGSFGEVEGDRFNSVYNTLQELYDVLRVEVQ